MKTEETRYFAQLQENEVDNNYCSTPADNDLPFNTRNHYTNELKQQLAQPTTEGERR